MKKKIPARRAVKVPITLTEKQCEAERSASGARQCAALYVGPSGSGVFCVRANGHEGDHRGNRTQWREES